MLSEFDLIYFSIKYLKNFLFQVQEIEKARILAEEKSEEVQTKENEARQLEQELREANIRVNHPHYLSQSIPHTISQVHQAQQQSNEYHYADDDEESDEDDNSSSRNGRGNLSLPSS